MKILFAGQLGRGQTTRMRMDALAALGQEIVPFDTQVGWQRCSSVGRRLQQTMGMGPAVTRLNHQLLTLAEAHRPDLFWGEKQEYLWPSTLRRLKQMGARLLHFTPDPYFTLRWKRTRAMDACLPLFDYILNCKRYEDAEYRRVCPGKVISMPLGFSEAVHRPLCPVDPARRRAFTCDVGFVGGWEPRREQLLSLVAGAGCNLKIWGYAWDHLVDGRWTPRRYLRLARLARGAPFRIARNAQLAASIEGGEIYEEEYAWALSSASIGIGFLRSICPDQHTTRTFEIPACGAMLLADRTGEHREFFQEGKEAEFFASPEELLDKVRYYVRNPDARNRIAEAGHRRCFTSGYSYKDRLSAVLRELT